MAFDPNNVIIEDNLDGLTSGRFNGYVAHVYCYEGDCYFEFNDMKFTISKGNTMIITMTRLTANLRPSEDFKAKVIYVQLQFLEASSPRNNYGIKGTLALYLNPVMKLTQEEQERCQADFEMVERRLNHQNHLFQEDMMMCTLQALFLDYFDFHARVYGYDSISLQNSEIMQRFFTLLESGIYREHRELSYYASELCITSKYLSELCKKITGLSANFWINRFTIIEINKLLKSREMSLPEIAEAFNFSSQAYFSRYVQNYLGQLPSNYRF